MGGKREQPLEFVSEKKTTQDWLKPVLWTGKINLRCGFGFVDRMVLK